MFLVLTKRPKKGWRDAALSEYADALEKHPASTATSDHLERSGSPMLCHLLSKHSLGSIFHALGVHKRDLHLAIVLTDRSAADLLPDEEDDNVIHVIVE